MKKLCSIIFVLVAMCGFVFGAETQQQLTLEQACARIVELEGLLEKSSEQFAQIVDLKRENRKLKKRIEVLVKENELLKGKAVEALNEEATIIADSAKEQALLVKDAKEIAAPKKSESKESIAEMILQSEVSRNEVSKDKQTEALDRAAKDDLARRQNLAEQAQKNAQKNIQKGERKSFQDKVF